MDAPLAAHEVRVAATVEEAAALALDLHGTPLSAVAFALDPALVLGLAAWSTDGAVISAVIDLRVCAVLPQVEAILRLRIPLVFHDARSALVALLDRGLDTDLPNLHDTHLSASCLALGAHHRRSREGVTPASEQEFAEQREHELTLEARCHALGVALSIPPRVTGTIPGVDPRLLAARASWTLSLYVAQHAELLREGLHHHLQTVEFPYAVANARMERRGVHLDLRRIDQVQAACLGAARHYADMLDKLGVRPPGSPEAFLQTMEGLGLGRHFAGRSLDDGSLRKLEGLHPAVSAFRLYRRFRQQGDQLRSAVVGPDGRVHPEHRQLGAATGRSTCRAPALASLDRVLRPVVTAPSGRALVELDYSQIELGVAAAELRDPALLDAYNSGDVYSAVAQRFFEDELADEERALSPKEFRARRPDLRDAVKPFVLAVLYGSEAQGVAARFGIPVREAEKRIARFLMKFPELVQELEDSADFGLARGHAAILTGLRRKVDREAPREWTRRFLRNTPIQGGAAVVFKRAVVELDKEFRGSEVWIVLTIYDAVLIECPADQAEAVIARAVPIMERALRSFYPALRPRVEVNRAHPECWNKDGHADSLERFLADPTFRLDRLGSSQRGFMNDAEARVMEYPEGERARFEAHLNAERGDVSPDEVCELFERYQERAAIREYDGGLPRAEAERLALQDVLEEKGAAS